VVVHVCVPDPSGVVAGDPMSFANFYIDNVPCIDPRSMWGSLTQMNWPLHNHTGANGVFCYRGRRPSEAHLLVPKSYVDSMDASAAHTIRIDYDGGVLNLPGWYVYKCEAASHGDNSNANQIFYMQLRDARQIGENTVFALATANISGTIRQDTTSGETQPSTVDWQDTLQDLWGMMPALAKAASTPVPTLQTSPASKAENLTFEGLSVWRAISRTLNACGHFAVLDPVTNAYSFSTWNEVQSGLSAAYSSAQGEEIWRGYEKPVTGLSVPENIRIIFPPERNNYRQQAPWGRPYMRIVSTGIPGAISETTWGVVDTSRKERDPGETEQEDPVNKTQLDNKADDLARYLRGVFAAFAIPDTRVYSGIQANFRVGSQLSEVAWVNDRRGVYTYTTTYEKLEIDLPGPYPEMPVLSVPYDTVVGYTASGAGARSGTTLGSGSARAQKIVGTTISDLEDEYANKVDITYLNLSESAVSEGYVVLVREMITGKHIVVWEDCG
jgi:hypothetical protein